MDRLSDKRRNVLFISIKHSLIGNSPRFAVMDEIQTDHVACNARLTVCNCRLMGSRDALRASVFTLLQAVTPSSHCYSTKKLMHVNFSLLKESTKRYLEKLLTKSIPTATKSHSCRMDLLDKPTQAQAASP